MLGWLCATGTWEYHINFRWVLQSFIINLTTLTNKDILAYQIHLTGPKRDDVCLLQLKNTNQFLRFLSGQDLDLEHFLSWQSLPLSNCRVIPFYQFITHHQLCQLHSPMEVNLLTESCFSSANLQSSWPISVHDLWPYKMPTVIRLLSYSLLGFSFLHERQNHL